MATRASKPVVCISGASAGIGAAAAMLLAERCYRLALGARRIERLNTLREQIKSDTSIVPWVAPLDVSSRESVAEFARGALEHFGAIDVILNNAGLAKGTHPLADVTDAEFDAMVDTNLRGAFYFVRAFLPHMIARKSGHIINLGSVAGHVVYGGGSIYCATKHALKALGDTLRLELNGTNIRVSSIDPGMVETEFSDVRFDDAERAKAIYKGMTPLTGRDIAECIAFTIDRPAHVNIDRIVLMPTDQAAVYKVHRRE